MKKTMEELECDCKIKDGFKIKEPFAKAGWTFFNLELSTEMASVIENSGMMKNAAAVPATVPNVEIMENPIGPQLQIPADAPIIEPMTLPPILDVLFCNVLIL